MSWKDTVNYTHVMRMCRGGSTNEDKCVMCLSSTRHAFVRLFETKITNYQSLYMSICFYCDIDIYS